MLKILMNSLKDISKWVQFYKAAAVQAYIFAKKRTPLEKNFNIYAKILKKPILHRGTTWEAYLEPVFRTSAMELFYKKY